MKLLYCIFAICVMANADPVLLTREQLKDLAESILKSIKYAPERIDNIIITTGWIVRDKLVKNKLVHELESIVEDKLNQSMKMRNNIPDDLADCAISIVHRFQKFLVDVNDDLLQKLTYERYGKQGDYLGTLKKELSDIKVALENHLDEEIESCLSGKNRCKLTHEYLSKSQEYFTFGDLMKPALESMAESSDEYFNSMELGNKIVVEIAIPAYECLNKLAD